MANFPSHTTRHLTTAVPNFHSLQRFHLSLASSLSHSSPSTQDPSLPLEAAHKAKDFSDPKRNGSKPTSYFPKKNQTLELVCESLAFKGKGVCKVVGTGFVVTCDRALPGERFIGRVTRRKGNSS